MIPESHAMMIYKAILRCLWASVLIGICAPLDLIGATVVEWKDAKKSEVLDGNVERHIIHSYFNTCPESPDGRYVLYFSSTDSKGEFGDVCILERATGKETVIAKDVTTEDAHRVACQQWVDNGRYVVYHDCRDGRWIVVAVELATLKSKILAEDHQVGFGSQTQPVVPIYGCHWNPGEYRDLELVNVESGNVHTAVTAKSVVDTYQSWLEKTFGSLDLSIFFPVLSPDGSKVFFKMSQPSGGDNFRSKSASERGGKVVYDLKAGDFVKFYPEWGHPSWHPDSSRIFERGNVLFDPYTGRNSRPCISAISDHPSVSPDGELFVTDADVTKRPFGKPGNWAIAVGSMSGDDWVVVDQFDNTKGAPSWRRNHPHPVFNADGTRIYYNVNDGPWTRLMVAEVGAEK